MNGIRIRFETNPAGRAPRPASSRDRPRAARIARAVSSEVSSPRITSTSFNTGTGLKKCMPITCVRPRRHGAERGDRDRRRVRREDRLRRQHLVRAPEDLLLHRARPRRPPRSSGRPARGRRRARCARAPRPVRRRPSRRASSSDTLDRREPALDGARRGVVQRDPAARGGDDLRDPAAHLARAHDENVLERHRARRLSSPACRTST